MKNLTNMDMIWIATAKLIYPHTDDRYTVTDGQITTEIMRLFHTTVTPVLYKAHLVSSIDRHADKKNPARGGSRNRYLFRTTDGKSPDKNGDYRLYMQPDSIHDGKDKTGKTCPEREAIPTEYHELLDWYLKECY